MGRYQSDCHAGWVVRHYDKGEKFTISHNFGEIAKGKPVKIGRGSRIDVLKIAGRML